MLQTLDIPKCLASRCLEPLKRCLKEMFGVSPTSWNGVWMSGNNFVFCPRNSEPMVFASTAPKGALNRRRSFRHGWVVPQRVHQKVHKKADWATLFSDYELPSSPKALWRLYFVSVAKGLPLGFHDRILCHRFWFLFGSFALEKNNTALPTKVRGAHQLGVQRVVECNLIYRWWQLKDFWKFHPENWGRNSPILTCAYCSKGVI